MFAPIYAFKNKSERVWENVPSLLEYSKVLKDYQCLDGVITRIYRKILGKLPTGFYKKLLNIFTFIALSLDSEISHTSSSLIICHVI